MAATEAFSSLWGSDPIDIADDDALVSLVATLHQRLSHDRTVLNPVDETEDLNRIPAGAWDEFVARLMLLNDAATAAGSAEDEASAALAWESAFGFLMPFPEADEIEVIDSTTEHPLMAVPDIRVEVYDQDGSTALASFRNEVPRVSRRKRLVFTIVNQHLVPARADISWTVRNAGDEADHVGDLGHARRGAAMFTAEESTAYIGKHYMDCVIRLDGSVVALRRIPVHVRPDSDKSLAQAQRVWHRLQSRRRRRR